MTLSNATWAGMIALGLKVTLHCAECRRWVDLDMTRLPPEGKAIGRTFRCSQCGGVASSIVSLRDLKGTDRSDI